MRTSLRSEPVQPVNLFAFLDIVFTATGVLMVIGVFFSLSPRLEKMTREPELPADTIERRRELQGAVEDWRRREALAEKIRQYARDKPRTGRISSPVANGPASYDSEALLVDEAALAANNLPLKQQIAELEVAIVRRLDAASKAEKTWLEREQRWLEEQRRNRRFLLKVDQSPSLKEVVLMVVTGSAIEVERRESPDFRFRLSAPWTAPARASLLSRFEPARQRFLLFFKPSGADYFEEMRAALKSAGFEVGYEPVPEEYAVNLHDRESPIQIVR